jgi:hypothetical protein
VSADGLEVSDEFVFKTFDFSMASFCYIRSSEPVMLLGICIYQGLLVKSLISFTVTYYSGLRRCSLSL